MLKTSVYFKFLLLAILLTLISIVLQPLLPERKLSLSPSKYKDATYFLMPVEGDPEYKKVYWVDPEKPFHFRCELTLEDKGQPCNMIFQLSKDGMHGTDLSVYQTIRFNGRYQGTARGVSLSMRNFDPRFSTLKNSNSGKYQWTYVRANDFNGLNNIPLREFIVADWWRDSFDLPREQTHQDFTNVVAFAVDIDIDIEHYYLGNVQDVALTDLEFVGVWVTKEQWYLAIILIWIVGGTIFTLWRLIYLMRKEKQQSRRISDLLVKNLDLETESSKFRRLSTVDALTNAFNRYGIEQVIESLVPGESRLISIIIFDIDNFKRVNDKRGHDCGDRVLTQVSQIVMTRTRVSDKFGRWGGEEFILICPDTSVGMAVAIAEKLRIYICTTIFEADNPLLVSASFGVAQVHPKENFSLAFKRADQALYQAKSLGRNRVVVAEGDSPFDAEIVRPS